MDPFDVNNPDFVAEMKRAEEFHDYIHSPEYRLGGRLRTFDTSLQIFERNYAELIRGIDHYQPKTRPEVMRWATDEAHRSDQQIEITRLLHNFVASASSLIDHARKFYREMYEGRSQMPCYQSKVSESFSGDGLSQFIVGLRQYCLHYRTPKITFSLKGNNISDTISGATTLDRDALLGYDGWNSVAKGFIKASPEAIDLAATCSAYRSKVRAFYQWFKSEQARIHEATIDYLDRMEEKFNQPS